MFLHNASREAHRGATLAYFVVVGICVPARAPGGVSGACRASWRRVRWAGEGLAQQSKIESTDSARDPALIAIPETMLAGLGRRRGRVHGTPGSTLALSLDGDHGDHEYSFCRCTRSVARIGRASEGYTHDVAPCHSNECVYQRDRRGAGRGRVVRRVHRLLARSWALEGIGYVQGREYPMPWTLFPYRTATRILLVAF